MMSCFNFRLQIVKHTQTHIKIHTHTRNNTHIHIHTHTHALFTIPWTGSGFHCWNSAQGHGYTSLLIRVFGIFNGADSRSPGKVSAECFAAFAVFLPGMG